MSTAQRRGIVALVAVAAATSLLLTGCTSKAAGSGETSADGVKTGAGISGDTITLGIMGDFTGPFAALSTDLARGIEVYWSENDVCGTYQVKLDQKDHGYDVQKAVSLYGAQSPNVLAYQAFVGGSHTSAVLDQAVREHKLIIPASATPKLEASENVMVPAIGYDVDAEVIIGRMVSDGKIAKGGTLASVYVEGDFGETAFKGVEAAGQRLGLQVLGYKVKPSDTDLSAAVTDAVSKGASAFFIGGTPGHTVSVASVLQASGQDLPIGGSWPSYTTSLLSSPAADYLVKNFIAGSPATTFDTAEGKELYAKLEKKYPGQKFTNQAAMGYGAAWIMDQVLESACKAGDLTPEGVIKARTSLPKLESNGVMPTMDYTKLGQSPTNEVFLFQFDPEVPGGLRNISDGPFTNLD